MLKHCLIPELRRRVLTILNLNKNAHNHYVVVRNCRSSPLPLHGYSPDLTNCDNWLRLFVTAQGEYAECGAICNVSESSPLERLREEPRRRGIEQKACTTHDAAHTDVGLAAY
jgi:hypothetical protein